MFSQTLRHDVQSSICLVGLDIGSTTSSLLAIDAKIQEGAQSATNAMIPLDTRFRSPRVLTPIRGAERNEIHIPALLEHLNRWFDQAQLQKCQRSDAILLTGLAAAATNARKVVHAVSTIFPDPLVAVAEDPHYESWLAFHGGAHTISRQYPQQTILNLDIGGGTTNLALGKNGEVLRTDWLRVGARHFEFDVDGHLAQLNPWGKALAKQAGVSPTLGHKLSPSDKARICATYVRQLEKAIKQMGGGQAQVTLSGGIGELYYSDSEQSFGDLGQELCSAIRSSNLRISDFVPPNQGRATVCGITLSSTNVSGSTIFVSDQVPLPLRSVPVVGRLQIDNTQMLETIGTSSLGAAVEVTETCPNRLQMIGRTLQKHLLKHRSPLVVLLQKNLGHYLGNLVTDWRNLALPLIVLDEITPKQANFVNVGRAVNKVLPVSFFGYRTEGKS